MTLVTRVISIGSAATLVVCCLLLILFGWSATGWKALAIPTSSMTPAIPKGSLVLVHSVPIQSLKVGDVITYINPLNPKTTLSHRIIKEYSAGHGVTGFVTKGDANKTADVPITEGSVIGKVIWHIPDAGNWLLNVKRPIVILPIVYLAAIIIMAEEVIRLRDYLRSNMPYRLVQMRKSTILTTKRLATVSAAVIAVVVAALAYSPSAFAFLTSNTAALVNNQLTVSSTVSCSTSSNTTVTTTNSNDQTASSGSATTSGNGNGNSANSGNASNSNSSTITVNASNC